MKMWNFGEESIKNYKKHKDHKLRFSVANFIWCNLGFYYYIALFWYFWYVVAAILDLAPRVAQGDGFLGIHPKSTK